MENQIRLGLRRGPRSLRQVMIAEPRSRRKGIAAEALHLLMAYAVQDLVRHQHGMCAMHLRSKTQQPYRDHSLQQRLQGVRCFRAKIGSANTASLALFRKLGFQPVSHSDYFNEDTLEISEAQQEHQHLRVVHLRKAHFDGGT